MDAKNIWKNEQDAESILYFWLRNRIAPNFRQECGRDGNGGRRLMTDSLLRSDKVERRSTKSAKGDGKH